MSSLFSFPPIVAGTQAFFPVVTRSVLYDDINVPGNKKVMPGKKIIVNAHTGEGLSIVPEAQLAVPHMDAYNLGVHIFQLLFGCSPIVYKERTNSNQTDYSVDLVNEQCKIMLTENGVRIGLPLSQHEHRVLHEDAVENDYEINRPFPVLPEHRPTFYDEYYPFVRVSNYLRAQASFEIEVGYYRWKCSNGLMFGRKTESTFEHSYICPGIGYITLMAENHFHRYDRHFLTNAIELWSLLKTYVPKTDMKLLVMQLFEEDLYRLKLAERLSVMNQLNILVEKYVLEIGENANAMINVATDLLKLLPCNRVSPSYLQAAVGEWMKRIPRIATPNDIQRGQLLLMEQELLHEEKRMVHETYS
jgi:hypothetical protein